MKAMKKLNEKEIIRIFRQKKNIAEDVELFHLGKELCAANIDTLVESTDIPAKSDLVAIARKSVVSSVSDFAAKGIIPKFCIISVTIPKTLSKNQITKMAVGFRKACDEFELELLGGDTNEGKEIVIHVVLFGKADKIVTRSGARNGDIIITTGPFGYTSSALQILLKKKKSTKKFSNIAKTKFFHPIPRLKFGIACKNLLSSSIDSSDGLSSCLQELSTNSKKRFVITKFPVKDDVRNFVDMNKLDLKDIILNGGEEFELVCTVPSKNLEKVKKNAKKLKVDLYEIGIVTRGKHVILENNTGQSRIVDGGWLHFE
jgi:thiamine-monophosphate kinase